MKIEDFEHVLRPILNGFHRAVSFYETLTNLFYVMISYTFYYFGLRKNPQIHMKSKPFYHPGVLITGATSGIGRNTALKLANNGYTVFACYRNIESGFKLIRDFNTQYDGVDEKKGRIILVELDLDKKNSINQCYDEVKSNLEQIKIPLVAIVNNAGFCTMSAMELTSKKDIKNQFHLVFDSYIDMIKNFTPLLKESKGRIININSVGSYMITPGFGVYCAAKAAMKMVTLSLRMELSRYSVDVVSIEPGFTNAKSIYLSSLKAYLKFYDENQNQNQNKKKNENHVDLHATGITSQGELTFADEIGAFSGQNESYLQKTTQDYQLLMDDWLNVLRFVRMIGQPTDNVSNNILHAVSSSYAKPSYISGFDARLYDWMVRFIPEDIIEWSLGKFMFPFINNEQRSISTVERRDQVIQLLSQNNGNEEPTENPNSKSENDNGDGFIIDDDNKNLDINLKTEDTITYENKNEDRLMNVGVGASANDIISSPLAGKMDTLPSSVSKRKSFSKENSIDNSKRYEITN